MGIYVIGEFGSNHEESLNFALRGIDAAKDAGCDAYKVQFWSSPERMRQRRNITPANSGLYDRGSIHPEWWTNLRDKCKDREIGFICSVFLPEDVPVVARYVDGFKVSSFEARDRELTRAITAVLREDKPDPRPFFISTGMQERHDETYLPKAAIKLHCVSAYPVPLEEANLGAIEMGEGYSDHTQCIYTGALAVAAGARFLEVHFRLQETGEQAPDYAVSLNPRQLSFYVKLARAAWLMRGLGDKRPMACEKENMAYRVIS